MHTSFTQKEQATQSISELKTGSLSCHRSIYAPSAPLRRGSASDRNTNLYEALDYLLERFGSDQEAAAFFVFSDGKDTYRSSRHSSKKRPVDAASVLQKAQESWAMFYPVCYQGQRRNVWEKVFPGVVIGVAPGFGRYDAECDLFSKLATATGGERYKFTNQQNLAVAFEEALTDLRSQYSLAYRPPDSERNKAYRRIKVRVKQPDLVARARDGYQRVK